MTAPTCATCHGTGEVCLSVRHNRLGEWTKTWISTKHCPTGGTGAPHRHNLVPCLTCAPSSGPSSDAASAPGHVKHVGACSTSATGDFDLKADGRPQPGSNGRPPTTTNGSE